MFGRKKMYKKGLADAMRAYEAFGKKQEDAIERIREEVRNGTKTLEAALSALGDDVFALYDYLDKKEKAALYKLSIPMDLKELNESDKQLLFAVLCQLADDEGSRYNENQRIFIRSVKKYLELTTFDMQADYSVIENIDSLDAQKVILRVCLEFMYLQDADELSDDQEEFFDNFSVNKRQAKLIEFEVIRQFHLLGADGMAEKYGRDEMFLKDVAVEENITSKEQLTLHSKNNQKASSFSKSDSFSQKSAPYMGIPLEIAEKLKHLSSSWTRIYETKDYVIVRHNDRKSGMYWTQFHKTTKAEKLILQQDRPRSILPDYEENKLIYMAGSKLLEYGILDESIRLIHDEAENYRRKMENSIFFSKMSCDVSACMNNYEMSNEYVVVSSNNRWVVVFERNNLKKPAIINRANGSLTQLRDLAGVKITTLRDCCAVINDVFYFFSECGNDITCKDGGALGKHFGAYNLITGELTRTNIHFGSSPSAVFVRNNQLFFYKMYDNEYNRCLILKRIVETPSGLNTEVCAELKRECSVKLYDNYLLYLDIVESGIYPMYVYDFYKGESIQIADHCYSRSNENMNLFSGLAGKQRKKWSYSAADYMMIGQWVYYTKKTSDWSADDYSKSYRVNCNSPMNAVEVK